MRTKQQRITRIPTRCIKNLQQIENDSESSDGTSSTESQHVRATTDTAPPNNNEESDPLFSRVGESIPGCVVSEVVSNGQGISQAIVEAGPKLLSLPAIVEALEKKVVRLEEKLAERATPQEGLNEMVAKLEDMCDAHGLVGALNALLNREAQIEVEEEAIRSRMAKLEKLDKALEARSKLLDRASQKVQEQKRAVDIIHDETQKWIKDSEKDRALCDAGLAKWANARRTIGGQNVLQERETRRTRKIPGRPSLRPLSDAAILKHGCTIELLPNGAINLERGTGISKDLLSALYAIVESWTITKPNLLTAAHLPGYRGKSCIDRTVIRRVSDWTSKDRAYACRMCAKHGWPCCRFVGDKLVVLPLHPDVRSPELGKGDIGYWILEGEGEEEGDEEADDEEDEEDDEDETEEEMSPPKRRCARYMGKRN